MEYRKNMVDFDEIPEAMAKYLKYNGPHFNSKLCDFAVSRMRDKNGPIKPYTKEQVDTMLGNLNITLKNNKLRDYVFVANMCKADFFGSSITDENKLILYVKDLIEDPDGYDGLVFNRWYADMCYTNVPISWEDMI